MIRDGTFFVAEEQGLIVGCGGWSRRRTQFGGDSLKLGVDLELDPKVDAARVRAFFILPGWERRGIGSEILAQCERAAFAAGFSQLEIVATLMGELLYSKFGYTVTKRYEVALGSGHHLPVVQMKKVDPRSELTEAQVTHE